MKTMIVCALAALLGCGCATTAAPVAPITPPLSSPDLVERQRQADADLIRALEARCAVLTDAATLANTNLVAAQGVQRDLESKLAVAKAATQAADAAKRAADAKLAQCKSKEGLCVPEPTGPVGSPPLPMKRR